MTIIYSNMGDVDCSLLPLMWRGLPNARTIEITPRSVDWESQVHAALVAETDTLILTGHGTQYGLLSRRVPLPQWVQSLQHYTNGIDVFNRRGVMDFTA